MKKIYNKLIQYIVTPFLKLSFIKNNSLYISFKRLKPKNKLNYILILIFTNILTSLLTLWFSLTFSELTIKTFTFFKDSVSELINLNLFTADIKINEMNNSSIECFIDERIDEFTSQNKENTSVFKDNTPEFKDQNPLELEREDIENNGKNIDKPQSTVWGGENTFDNKNKKMNKNWFIGIGIGVTLLILSVSFYYFYINTNDLIINQSETIRHITEINYELNKELSNLKFTNDDILKKMMNMQKQLLRENKILNSNREDYYYLLNRNRELNDING